MEVAYAVHGSRKAPVLVEDDLSRYLSAADPDLAESLTMIAFTGCRNIDLTRLPVCQVWIEANEGQIEYRWTKNRQKIGKSFVWRLRDAKAIFGRPFPRNIRHNDAEDATLRWSGMTTNNMNKRLKELAASKGLPPATSYSFRNFFMNRIFVHCKWVWADIIELTGHIEVETVKAYYDRLRPPMA
jgi:integrase